MTFSFECPRCGVECEAEVDVDDGGGIGEHACNGCDAFLDLTVEVNLKAEASL